MIILHSVYDALEDAGIALHQVMRSIPAWQKDPCLAKRMLYRLISLDMIVWGLETPLHLHHKLGILVTHFFLRYAARALVSFLELAHLSCRLWRPLMNVLIVES